MRAKFGWLVIIGVIGAGALALWWQRETQVRLRRDLGKLREENHELARLRDGNRRLAAAQPSAAELDNLRADHTAIPQLRAEIDAMQERMRIAAEKSAVRSPERFAAGSKVLAGEWKNVGAATPKTALETVLWAAAGGDVDTFASCLLLAEGRGRQQATALLESLPAEKRAQYATPERLIAFLAIRDVPIGAAQVMEWNEPKGPASPALVQLQLSAPDGITKELNLWFSSRAAGWKLVVPDSAIARYAAMLKGPPVAAGENK
jgi:hypothetical protein